MQREQRWVVLATDGRHVTLGRHVPPAEEEVAKASSALVKAGLTGWLAGLDGDYWSGRTPVVLTMIEPLAHAADADWPAAVAVFEAMRRAATSSNAAPRH